MEIDVVEQAVRENMSAYRQLVQDERIETARHRELEDALRDARAAHAAIRGRPGDWRETPEQHKAARAVRQAEEALERHSNRCDYLRLQVELAKNRLTRGVGG